VATAHRQAAAAAEAQSSSLTKVDDAMKALSPAGKTFALFLFSLRHRFDELKATAQEGLLPGVQSGIQSLLPLLPTLNRIVGNAAQAMGDLFAQAGKALTSPFWKSFFDMIANTVGPNLKMFGGLLLNLGQGFAGLLMAFQPLNAQLGAGLLNLSQRFAEFGAGASKSGGFQAFIAYVQQVGPQIIATIRSVATTIGRIAIALAPIGPIVLQSIGFLADMINRIPIADLTTLAVAIGGLVLGFRVLAGVIWLVNVAMDANIFAIVAVALVALGAAFVIAYRHSETFRNVVNAAWNGIKAAAAATWTFLQGVFSTLGGWLDGIKNAFTAFSGVVSSVWGGVKGAISTAWGFIVGVFNAIVGFLSGPLHTAFSIWRQIVQTEFEIVRAVIVVAWAIISKIFSAIVGWVRDTITTAFRNFKTNITAIWNAVAGAIQYAWDKWFHPVFKAIGDWVGPKLKTAFDNAKTNLTAIWNAIAGVIQFAWDKWFHPVFKAISDWVGPKLKTAFDNAKTNLTRIWNGIAGVVKDAWDKVIKPAFKAVRDAITVGVPKAFEKGVDAIKTAWDKIKEYAKAPVRFILQTVLDHGILAAFNSIAEKVLDKEGAKKVHINSVTPKGFARGTEDHRAQIAHPNQPRLWAEPETGGEAYIPLAPSKRPRSARILRDVAERFGYGLVRMANGGTLITAGRHLRELGYDVTEGPDGFGPIHHVHAPHSRHYDGMAIDVNHGAGTSKVEQAALSKIVPYLQGLGLRILFMVPNHKNHLHAEVPRAKGLGSQIGGLVKGAAGAVADFLDPRQLIEGPLSSLLAKLPGRDSTFGKIVAGAPKSIATMLINKAKEFVGLGSGDTKDFSGGGGAEFGGSGTARWRGIVTQVVAMLGQPASAVDAVLRRIQFESGGNPHAVNLTDSNARAGHPSQGLMQVIPGTFNAYSGPYMARGIRDPFANIYAGANYALHTYHSLAAIDPRNRPRGYDAGGFLQPGLTTVYNGTGKPEPVFTAEQFAAMRQGMGARTGVVIQGDVHTASVDEFAREMGARQRLDEALHPLFA
jgi:phage-related protein